MKTRTSNRWRIAATACALGITFHSTAAELQLVTATDPSVTPPASAGGDSMFPIMSDDGRFVLFASTANNLALSGSNSLYSPTIPYRWNLFVRDRTAGTNQLVSANLAGSGGADESCTPLALSTNGRYALFYSCAANLVANDTNGVADAFVRDLSGGSTFLVSINTNGASADGTDYDAPYSNLSSSYSVNKLDATMSEDGRYVAFASPAADLVADDTNRIADIFVRDLQTGTTVNATADFQNALFGTVSVGGGGGGGIQVPISRSDLPRITADGRRVLFYSTATNVVSGATNIGEFYVRDLIAQETYAVSLNAHSIMTGAITLYNQTISADGQYVAFEARSTTPLRLYVFRSHVASGALDLVATNAVTTADTLDISPDGRFIAYVGTTNVSLTGVFVWDAESATAVLASANLSGQASAGATPALPILEGNGSRVAFMSTATDLTTNTVGSGTHLYVRDLEAGFTSLVDVGTNGTAPVRDLMDGYAMSANGRFVAFNCAGVDLVPNDGNQSADVFVRDLDAGTTELVSAHDAALPSGTSTPGCNSGSLSVSADGRYAAYASAASALVASCTNRHRGVFVNDLLYGTNLLASLDTNGLPGANGMSIRPVISGNGRYVAFVSFASNLAVKDTNNAPDLFVRDLQAGITRLVSAATNGFGAGTVATFTPAISTDGRYVLYLSKAAGLVGGVAGGFEKLYLRDDVSGTNRALMKTGTAYSASMTPDGRYVALIGMHSGDSSASLYVWDSQVVRLVFTNSTASLTEVAISPDGRWLAYVAFSSLRILDRLYNTNKLISNTGLGAHAGLRFSADGQALVYATSRANVSADTNHLPDVYLYDFASGTNALISRDGSGNAGSNASDSPDISGDGRYVVYQTLATNIVSSDAGGVKNIMLYDRRAGTSTLLSASAYTGRGANLASGAPRFTGDGQTVVFQSWASDLIENDFNQGADVFVIKLASGNPIAAFSGQIIYAPGSGQPPTILWPATNGVTYQVQYKNELTDPTWLPITGTVTVEGGQGSAVDLAPNPNHRFYRIVAF